MKKLMFFLMVFLAFFLQGKYGRGAALPCNSGGICVTSCPDKTDGHQYSFKDFVHVNNLDGFYMRLIQENSGLTGDTQIHNALARITDLNQSLSKDLETQVSFVKKVVAKTIKAVKAPVKIFKKCHDQTLARYNYDLKKFVMDTQIFEKLNPTDQAGVIVQMTCMKLLIEKNVPDEAMVNCQRLTRRLFIKPEDNKKIADYVGAKPMTAEEEKRGIQNLMQMFPQSSGVQPSVKPVALPVLPASSTAPPWTKGNPSGTAINKTL